MFSPRVFTMMALLAVCAAGSIGPAADSTADRPADRTGHRENGTFPLRSKYNKDRKAKSLKDIIKEEFKKQKGLHRSWNLVEVTGKNKRVFIKVKGYKRSELRVVVEKNWLKASGNSHARVHNMFTNTERLPANAVVSAISATLTSDGFLVVDIPIDKRAPKSSQRKWNVPIVESGKPLDSKHLNIPYFHSDSSYSRTSLNTEKDWIKLEKDHRPWNWIESTDKNIRVIMKVEKYKRSELRVRVKNNWVKASGNSTTALVQMFIHTEPLPANAVVSAINATLTSDEYLVVDIPIDKRAPKSSQRERNVPIVESGKPLDSIYVLNITHSNSSNSHTSLKIEDWIKLEKDRPWNWIEATEKNIRVITKVEGYKRSELRVRVNNWLKASGNSHATESVYNNNMFTLTKPLPANAVVSAINATLTSDEYLVLDIPIDKRAPKSSQRERNVPIVESGKPLDSIYLNITHLYGDSSYLDSSDTSLDTSWDTNYSHGDWSF